MQLAIWDYVLIVESRNGLSGPPNGYQCHTRSLPSKGLPVIHTRHTIICEKKKKLINIDDFSRVVIVLTFFMAL